MPTGHAEIPTRVDDGIASAHLGAQLIKRQIQGITLGECAQVELHLSIARRDLSADDAQIIHPRISRHPLRDLGFIRRSACRQCIVVKAPEGDELGPWPD